MPVRVIIVDDHPVFLYGLRALLELNNEIEIIGEARNREEAVDLIYKLKPDIVVMDIIMPGMN